MASKGLGVCRHITPSRLQVASIVSRLSDTAQRRLSTCFSRDMNDKTSIRQLVSSQPLRESHAKIKLTRRRAGLESNESTDTRALQEHRGHTYATTRKLVTAYCIAEQYDVSAVSRLLKADGYVLDPCKTGLHPQVVHVQTGDASSGSREIYKPDQSGDIFIFPSGTVVGWNIPKHLMHRLLEQVLLPAVKQTQPGALKTETEYLEYVEDSSSQQSSMLGDTIVLSSSPGGAVSDPTSDSDATLTKLAFSSGLARSTKLAVLERLTNAYIESTRKIPTIMAQGTPLPFPFNLRPLRSTGEALGLASRLPFTRSFMLRRTGSLLSIRALLNLFSELTDSLPDLFWDAKHELRLDEYYDQIAVTLDISARIKVLNDKIDYAQDIASVLRETLSERHGLRLEWVIIGLIAIEVVFGVETRVEEYLRKSEDV